MWLRIAVCVRMWTHMYVVVCICNLHVVCIIYTCTSCTRAHACLHTHSPSRARVRFCSACLPHSPLVCSFENLPSAACFPRGPGGGRPASSQGRCRASPAFLAFPLPGRPSVTPRGWPALRGQCRSCSPATPVTGGRLSGRRSLLEGAHSWRRSN